MRTPPPAVPGIADANSNPPRPAVRARVQAPAPAGPPGIRGGNPTPAETGRARPVQADGVRRAAACDELLALDARLRELARQLHNESADAVVCDEDVRPEADRLD